MTGDQNDMLARLKAVLPNGWFPDETPVLDAVLTGIAYAWAWAFSLISYASLQTRLLTATGIFLNILAIDFFGTNVSRADGESDDTFRARMKRDVLQPKATRAAVISAVQDLTTETVRVVEPWNASDTGGYSSLLVPGSGGGVGYGLAGAYGSRLLPFQAFLTVVRPKLTGIPLVAGYNTSASGYGTLSIKGANLGASDWASLDEMRGVRDTDIYSLIASTAPAAVIVWTQITDVQADTSTLLDLGFILDQSQMS